LFGKRLHEITKDDIERLVAEAVQEDGEIEFKETLPARKGRDAWLDGGDRIGDRARNEIIEEVIAFANAHGGTLVLGISESDDKPARAAGVVPLPRCADLAERLRLQCRDCIEPQVSLLEIGAVIIEDDGSGVIVIRALKSRMAPHRHTATKECYVRRADRSEKMTMREIQDLTLQVERGLAAIDSTFDNRSRLFVGRLRSFKGGGEHAFGMCATVLPLEPIFIDRVHNNDAVRPPSQRIPASMGNDGRFDVFPPPYSLNWRPILRGSRGVDSYNSYEASAEVHCNGIIEYSYLERLKGHDPLQLYPSWVMGMMANALYGAERFRRAAGVPGVEYGLEIAIGNLGGELPIGGYVSDGFRRPFGNFPGGHTVFPRYSVGSPEEFQSLTTVFEQDFWHAAGLDWGDAIKVDYASVIPALKPQSEGT